MYGVSERGGGQDLAGLGWYGLDPGKGGALEGRPADPGEPSPLSPLRLDQ